MSNIVGPTTLDSSVRLSSIAAWDAQSATAGVWSTAAEPSNTWRLEGVRGGHTWDTNTQAWNAETRTWGDLA